MQLTFFQLAQAQLITEDIAMIQQIRAVYEVTETTKSISDTTAYTYFDESYRTIEDFSAFDTYVDKYSYEQGGQLIIKNRFRPTKRKRPYRTWKYFFNEKHQLIKEECKWDIAKGKDLIQYVYYKNGQLKEQNEYNNHNEVFKSISYQYYDDDKLKEKTFFEKYYKAGNKIEIFDKCGNKIKLKQYNKTQSKELQWAYNSFCSDINKTTLQVDTIEYTNGSEVFIAYIITQNEDKVEYHYNKEGDLMQFSFVDYGYDKTIGSYRHEYFNKEGQLIESKSLRNVGAKCIYGISEAIKQNNKYYEQITYQYRDDNVLERSIWYDAEGNTLRTKIYIYIIIYNRAVYPLRDLVIS